MGLTLIYFLFWSNLISVIPFLFCAFFLSCQSTFKGFYSLKYYKFVLLSVLFFVYQVKPNHVPHSIGVGYMNCFHYFPLPRTSLCIEKWVSSSSIIWSYIPIKEPMCSLVALYFDCFCYVILLYVSKEHTECCGKMSLTFTKIMQDWRHEPSIPTLIIQRTWVHQNHSTDDSSCNGFC